MEITGTAISFLLSGKYLLSVGKEVGREVIAGKMLLFPPGSLIRVEFLADSTVTVSREHEIMRLCECFPIEKLYQEGRTVKPAALSILDIHGEMQSFLDHYIRQYTNGLKCIYYAELKNKELFFLLRAYYRKEDLAGFFAPLLTKDLRFSYFVYQNYRKVNSVQELIALSSYSVSGFKKRFQETFGTSASEWLRDKRAKNIFHDLNCSPLSIKELCYKFDFASVSSFNAFCKSHFGLPPGGIRKRNYYVK